jgi:hypothetical protein
VRQLNNDLELKERVLKLLARDGEEGRDNQLIQRFGDKEYSILSAIGSSRR